MRNTSAEVTAIFTAFGTHGHVDPIIGIASATSALGVRAVVLTHSYYLPKYRGLGVELTAIDSDAEFEDLSRHLELLNKPATVPLFFEQFVFPLARREYGHIIDFAKKANCVLVTADAPGIGARLAAESASIPLVSVLTGPGFARARPLFTSMLADRARKPFNSLCRSLGIQEIADLNSWVEKASKTIALWPGWFAPDVGRTIKNFHPVGFTWSAAESTGNNEVDTICDAEYDIVITGGSNRVAGRDFFSLAVNTCGSLRLRTAVVARHQDLLPNDLCPWIKCLDWIANLSTIVGKSRLVIHHGGMGTIAKCLSAGVPQLILAAGGDRPENARRIHELKVGLYLPRYQWNTTNLTDALGQIAAAGFRTRAGEFRISASQNGSVEAAKIVLLAGAEA